MSPLQKNKYVKTSLITFGTTSLFLAFGFYRSQWPYQSWFKPVATIYALSLLVFTATIIISNLYSLLVWGISKKRKEALNTSIVIGPAISITVIIGFLCSPFIPRVLPNGSYLEPFNSELWIADDSTEMRGGINNRQKMLGDAAENILPGKTKNEIIKLLGLPSGDSNRSSLLFYLGPARGDFFGVEVEWLKVYLDPSGRFDKYEVFRED